MGGTLFRRHETVQATYSGRRWWWPFRGLEKHAARPHRSSGNLLRDNKLVFLDSFLISEHQIYEQLSRKPRITTAATIPW
ncbi:hypothetical protein Y032_0077g1086 [Ancylostoma ceylanicum]|nr:hypothetical protein Y032_0077g1086 [Ancylostoma ceylanicum]